ncbi:MAG: ATP-binding protein [Alphaproteobacteria bacterium]
MAQTPQPLTYAPPALHVRVIGALLAVLGLVVMTGWIVESKELVQISANFEPMKFNTALLFLLCGVGFLTLDRSPAWLPRAAGGLVAGFALLVLIEYAVDVDLGIDTLFVTPFTMKRTEFPGRFSINTAVAFVLCGLAICERACNLGRFQKYGAFLLAIVGSAVTALGTAALFAYLTGTQDHYIWGFKIGMAAHTSVSFVILGITFISMSWERSDGLPAWAPLPVFLMLTAVTLALWQAVLNDDQIRLRSLVEAEARSAGLGTQQHLHGLYTALDRMRARWEVQKGTRQEWWEKDALAYLKAYPVLNYLSWADRQSNMQWTVSLKGITRPPGFNAAFEKSRAEAIDAAKRTGQPQMTNIVPLLQGGNGFVYYLPLRVDGRDDGIIIAAFSANELFETVLPKQLLSEFKVSVHAGDRLLYPTQASDAETPSVSAFADVEVAGRQWRFTLSPLADFLDDRKSTLPDVTLAIGIFIALLSAVCTDLAVKSNRVSLRLRHSRDQISYFVKHLPVAVAICDMDMRYLMVSDRWYSDFGLKDKNIIGMTHHEVFFNAPAHWKDILDDCLKNGKDSTDEEKVEFKSGRAMWMRWDVRPWHEANGAIGGLIMATEIITERKEAEQTLKSAKIAADAANKAKSEFMASMNHELRTPLTSIRGALGLIDGGALGPIPERAAEMVKRAYKNSERLSRLINDILDLEKIEAGKMQINIKNVPLDDILQQSIEANQGYGAKFGVRFVLEEVPEHVEVMADPDRLMQVLANLLSNAAKFSSSGSDVIVRARLNKSKVHVEVEDHGKGIPDEFKARIFEKFSQADAADNRKSEGTGLGLSIVKLLVEEMGGSVGFRSEANKGTTFFFDLPGYVAAQQKKPAAAEGPKVSAGNVLICEDDKGTADFIRFLLEREGFSGDIVRTLREARQKVGRNPYVAVTLDLAMPDGSGVDFLHELRGNPDTQALPVVIVSGKADEAKHELSGGALNVADWLVKPFEQDRIIGAVRAAVSGMGRGKPLIMHVEDDRDLSLVIKEALRGKAEIVAAHTLQDAERELHMRAFDLVILDIALPDGCGLDLLELIPRIGHKPPPVLILSASETAADVQSRVSAALVKSQISEEKVIETILSLVQPKSTAAPKAEKA